MRRTVFVAETRDHDEYLRLVVGGHGAYGGQRDTASRRDRAAFLGIFITAVVAGQKTLLWIGLYINSL